MVATIPFPPEDPNQKRSQKHKRAKSTFTPEQRELLARYCQQCKTGQYDFPHLVDLAHATYEISKSKPGELLLPRKIEALCRRADRAVEQLTQHSFNFSQTLDQLGERLSNHKPSPNQLRLITQDLLTDIAPLHVAGNTLIDLTQKHGPAAANWLQRLRFFSSDTDFDETQALLRYHSDSLRYILSFLDTHSQTDIILTECPQGEYWENYSYRLISYCNVLPRHGKNLSERLQKFINDKAPDSKFASAPEED